MNTLEDEIHFIEDQTVLSEEKNSRLNEEAKYLKLEILKYKPDFEFWEEDPQGDDLDEMQIDGTSNKTSKKGAYANYLTQSVEKGRKPKNQNQTKTKRRASFLRDAGYKSADEGYIDEQEVARLTRQYDHEQKNYEILTRLNDHVSFQKGKFEEIFEECIKKGLTEKNLESTSNPSTRLPALSQSDGVIGEEGELSQADTNINMEKIKLAEMKLTAQERKVMIEEFLGSQSVKEFLYNKFVEEPSKKTGRHLL